MVNRTSSLSSNYLVGKKTNNNINLKFKEIKNIELTQIAVWPETINEVGMHIANYLKLPKFAEPNKAVTNDKFVMMRIEPLKWWLLGSEIPLISTDQGTTLDLSHSYTQILVSGTNEKTFLNRFMSIDLREKSFPLSSVASSAIHHVSVKLWRSEDGYNIFIPRGFALSLWELFNQAASQFGYEIE